jgi:hypothetical protein
VIRKPCLAASALCICIAACAVPPAATDVAMIAAPGKQQAIRAGQSSKADVIAALGSTKVLRFDSGFEVWIYHLDQKRADEMAGPDWLASKSIERQSSPAQQADSRDEFIVLFAPSGIVAKTRVRPKPM